MPFAKSKIKRRILPFSNVGLKGWLYSVLHAILMIILLFAWHITGLGVSLEARLSKIQSAIKNTTFISYFYTPTLSIDDIVFVDVSNNKVKVLDLATGNNDYITDRHLLDSVFQLLKENSTYRYIICDLGFEVALPDDSATLGRFRNIPRTGFSLSPVALPNSPEKIYQLPGGVTQYTKMSVWWKFTEEVLKFQLINENNEKSLPLVMAETLLNRKYEKRTLFLKEISSGKKVLNSITIDAHIRPYQLSNDDHTSKVYTLEDLATMINENSPEAVNSLLKDKIIVIGDYTNDTHETAYGKMPGALILLNIFISLAQGENTITVWWLLYLLIAFTFISATVFYKADNILSALIHKVTKIIQTLFLSEALSEVVVTMFLLLIFSLISYFIFQKGFDLLILSIWIKVLDWVQSKKKNTKYFQHRKNTLRNNIFFILYCLNPCKKNKSRPA